MSDISRLAQRIRDEYHAVPGLKITPVQAARLWSAPAEACNAAFDALVAEGLLWLAPSGRYVALPGPDGAALKSDVTVARCPHCQKRNSFERELTGGRHSTTTLRCVACQRVFTFSMIAA
jgi:hypothetical protein